MFPEISYDYKDYRDYCVNKFGVEPAPHWVTTYYGGEVWLLSLSLSLSLSLCVSDLKMMYMTFFFFVSQCKIAANKKGSPQVW